MSKELADRQFEYLLNAMENAAQSASPALQGYGEKRKAVLDYVAALRSEPVGAELAINPTGEAADAFWRYWKANGETHKHGYYESTWGAINAALRVAGVCKHIYAAPSREDQRESNSNPAPMHGQSKTGPTGSHPGAPTQDADELLREAMAVLSMLPYPTKICARINAYLSRKEQ